MGQTFNTSSLYNRIHSWAQPHALNQNRTEGRSRESVPPSIISTTKTHNVTSPPPGSPTSNGNTIYDNSSHVTNKSGNDVGAETSASIPSSAPRPQDTQEDGETSATMTTTEKPKRTTRIRNGVFRFIQHTKDAITHSWINVLLVFVPIGIAMEYAPLPEHSKATIVFSVNAVAIVPLAGLLAYATESVACRMGDTVGALMNVTFGNAVEMIVL